MSSVGPHESVGGDIKFLRLKQREIGGLVTDGSVRDTDEIINYGFPVSFYSPLIFDSENKSPVSFYLLCIYRNLR